MSIYYYRKELRSILNKNLFIDEDENKIVAKIKYPQQNITLTDESYLNEIINKFDYINIEIDPLYWNKRYCLENMLKDKTIEEMIQEIDFYEFFNKIYTTPHKDFIKILDNLSVGGINRLFDLVVKNPLITPLNNNYLCLIKRAIPNEYLEEFLTVRSRLRFTPKELEMIFLNLKYKTINIHSFSNAIFKYERVEENIIKYINILLDHTDHIFDPDKIYITDKTIHLGFFLSMMQIKDELLELMERYKSMGGNLTFIIEDEELKNKMNFI